MFHFFSVLSEKFRTVTRMFLNPIERSPSFACCVIILPLPIFSSFPALSALSLFLYLLSPSITSFAIPLQVCLPFFGYPDFDKICSSGQVGEGSRGKFSVFLLSQVARLDAWNYFENTWLELEDFGNFSALLFFNCKMFLDYLHNAHDTTLFEVKLFF